MNAERTAIVIGAGASGLSAAHRLKQQGVHVIVVEASSKVGGRVFHDTSLSQWPLELGPEFVHGEKENLLIDLVSRGLRGKPGAELIELEWPNFYYFGKEGTLVPAAEADELDDVSLMHESFEALGELKSSASLPEQTLLQYFAARGLSSRVLDLADAIFANDYVRQHCTDLHTKANRGARGPCKRSEGWWLRAAS